MERFPRVRRWLEQLLHTHDTPERTAAAFAIGVFFGFSPFLGLHTALGLLFAFALNLNRVAVVLGVFANVPWILPAYYTVATLAGAALLGSEVPPGRLSGLIAAIGAGAWRDALGAARTLTPLLWAYTVGSTVGAVALAAAAYWLALWTIVAHRRHAAAKHPQTSEEK